MLTQTLSLREDGRSQKVDKEAAGKHLSRYCRLSGAIMNRNGFKGRLRLTNAGGSDGQPANVPR